MDCETFIYQTSFTPKKEASFYLGQPSFFHQMSLMFSSAGLPRIYEKIFAFEEDSILFYAYFFLTNEEKKAIREAFSSTLSVHEQVPSLRKNRYVDKKRDLILKALNGLLLSKTHRSKCLCKICNLERDGRVLSKNIGIYKKNRDVFREALVWELSIILGCDQFIAPSLPFHIYGSEATFQPYFSVSCCSRFVQDGQEMPKEMNLEDYWILALYAFLIGHTDLNGTNLHFTENGYILLDNDCSFPLRNNPISANGRSLSVPLQNVLLDFNCSQKPLAGESFERVKSILNDWKDKEKDVKSYFAISSLVQRMNSKMSEQAFWERWRKILDAHLSPGMNLRMFIQKIFPEHFKQIDIAQRLASQILGCPVGPMSSLHLLGSYIYYCPVEETTLKKVYEWINFNHVY